MKVKIDYLETLMIQATRLYWMHRSNRGQPPRTLLETGLWESATIRKPFHMDRQMWKRKSIPDIKGTSRKKMDKLLWKHQKPSRYGEDCTARVREPASEYCCWHDNSSKENNQNRGKISEVMLAMKELRRKQSTNELLCLGLFLAEK